jgi:hypothetical protein
MDELTNKEVFQVVHGIDAERRGFFSLLLKRTYEIKGSGNLVRSEFTTPLRKIDEYYEGGDPDWATVKYEAELVPYKPCSELILIGKAYAPTGRTVESMEVSLSVGSMTKTIYVLGERECRHIPGRPPAFTEPRPFREMEIRYERAFGGKDEISDPQIPLSYPRNDMGCGFVLKNIREKVEGLSLPNLEDPNDLITPERIILEDPYRWNSLPLPQGFGWMHRSWYPRSSLIGSLPPFVDPDEVMREEALGLVPRRQVALARQFKLPSLHPFFQNGASIGLAFSSFSGTEPIRLSGLTPCGTLAFELPGDKPKLMLDIGLGEHGLEPFLHTVCVRSDDMQVDLIWRGAHRHPGLDWLPKMKRLHAEVG